MKAAADVLSAAAADKAKPRGHKPTHGVSRAAIAEAVGVGETTIREAEQHVETAEHHVEPQERSVSSFGHGHHHAARARCARTSAARTLHLQRHGRHALLSASEPHIARVPLPVPRDRNLIPVRFPGWLMLTGDERSSSLPSGYADDPNQRSPFHAIQITATMSQTTVSAFIGSALRETQIAFFTKNSERLPDVVVLDFRGTPPPSTRRRGEIGALQSAIMDHLVGSPTGIYDLREVRRTMLHDYHGPALSRAFRALGTRGFLQSMTPTGTGFRPGR